MSEQSCFQFVTDFGAFSPDSHVCDKLAKVRITKRGTFDQRFRRGKVAQRYQRAVFAWVRNQWENGNDGPYKSPANFMRVTMARIRLKGES